MAKLKAYKWRHGDCNVPRGWAEDPRLANWVANQRKYKKWLDRGHLQPGTTAVRSVKLDALGFVWELQRAKHTAMVARRAIALRKRAHKLHKRAPRHEPGDVQPGQQRRDSTPADALSISRRTRRSRESRGRCRQLGRTWQQWRQDYY